MPGKVTKENIQDSLTFTTPNAEQQRLMNEFAQQLITIGNKILDQVPDGLDRTHALDRLRELRNEIEQAIILNGLV